MMTSVDNDPLGVFGASSDVEPIESFPPEDGREHRRETRYRVTWKVDIAIEGQDLHDGRLNDISLHGASILLGRNLKADTEVTLRIYIPSITGPYPPTVLTVHGMTRYTVHDSDDLLFRVGIAFTEFDMVSDRGYLDARLTSHHLEIT
ncbi:MAG: PilZ domain-containing protein [Nitrosomonadales bacterium]|nr:PilZ domain-containing protein [Nitrosomonadales bacterium]